VPTLSLSSLTVLPCSPVDQIDAAQDAGFDAVGLRIQPTLPSDIDVMADVSLRRAIERRIGSTGLRVLDVDVSRVGPQTDVTVFEPLLAYAGYLGAENLVITSLPRDQYRASEEFQCARKIAELCEVGARHGVRPILEFIPFRGIASLDQAVRIAKLVDHSNFAICVDTLHLCRSGGDPAELANVDPRLIACIQLCDAPQPAPDDLRNESRYGRLYPGEGMLPLIEIMRAAPPNVPVSVEAPSMRRQMRSPFERAQEAAHCARRVLAVARAAAKGSLGNEAGSLN
jgi:sugar phosphate isomerase/epimerase